MNKSIEFIKKRIAEGYTDKWIPNYPDGWDVAEYMSPIYCLNHCSKSKFKNDMTLRMVLDDNHQCKIHVIYDPNAEFDYVSFSHSWHDGTLGAAMDNFCEVCARPYKLQTVNVDLLPHDFDKDSLDSICSYDYEYIIGDVVGLDVLGESVVKDKPWLCCHNIAGLPIRMRFIKRNGKLENNPAIDEFLKKNQRD